LKICSLGVYDDRSLVSQNDDGISQLEVLFML